MEYSVFLWKRYLDDGACVLQTEVCCGHNSLLFGPEPPFLSCQLKSHWPLQMLCQILENSCLACSTDYEFNKHKLYNLRHSSKRWQGWMRVLKMRYSLYSRNKPKLMCNLSEIVICFVVILPFSDDEHDIYLKSSLFFLLLLPLIIITTSMCMITDKVYCRLLTNDNWQVTIHCSIQFWSLNIGS